MLSANCSVSTVSGDLAQVRGCMVLEVELGGRFYCRQFTDCGLVTVEVP